MKFNKKVEQFARLFIPLIDFVLVIILRQIYQNNPS